MPWTYEKIRSFAPDAQTLAQANGLANSNRWIHLEGNENYLAGHYKTPWGAICKSAILLDNGKNYCSCNSSKHPCRHALSLLLLAIKVNDRFHVTPEPPDWVVKQLMPIKKDHPLSPNKRPQKSEQQTKQFDKRLQLMHNGIMELENWLLDLVRQGLAAQENHIFSSIERIASRMVDAKLGGVARRLRFIKTLSKSQDWHFLLLEELAEVYLFVQAFKRLNTFSEPFQREILNQAGVNLKKEEVLNQSGISDSWLVLGQREGMEDNLRFRRTWLLGKNTKHPALILDFVWGNADFPDQWVIGHTIQGEVVYYPGIWKQRALVKKIQSTAFEKAHQLKGFSNFESFTKNYATALSYNPWLHSFPTLLETVRPIYLEGKGIIIDKEKKQLPLRFSSTTTWQLLALSAGQPITLFGEWEKNAFSPLTVLKDGRIIPL